MNTTAIIVSYKQTHLIKACFESIRKFYPELPVIIIDGSPADSDCWAYCLSIQDEFTTVKCLEYNIGHGKGLHMGIGMAKTDYVLLVDSDVELLKKGSIESMLELSSKDTYGLGQIVEVDENGNNYEGGIEYLHPHFALINKSVYEKFSPLINHGAPMLKAMLDLNENFHYNLESFPIHKHIIHHERGTRELNPPEFHPGNWDSI